MNCLYVSNPGTQKYCITKLVDTIQRKKVGKKGAEEESWTKEASNWTMKTARKRHTQKV